jgi:uncharacterized membrane protein YfcA
MDTRLYLTIAGIAAIVFGIGFVLMPAMLLALYGESTPPNAVLNIQFFGSSLIGVGVIAWFAKDARDSLALRAVLTGLLIGDVVGLGVNLWGTFSGVLNALAWSTTVLYVLLIAGAAYCLSNTRKAA